MQTGNFYCLFSSGTIDQFDHGPAAAGVAETLDEQETLVFLTLYTKNIKLENDGCDFKLFINFIAFKLL